MFDDDHKKLFDLVNEFYKNVTVKSSKEILKVTVKGLKDYTGYHFNREEKYMKEFNYPGYDAQKKEHDAFIQKVNEFQKKLDDGSFMVTVEVTNFIKDWLTHHIKVVDKQYETFFKEKGLN